MPPDAGQPAAPQTPPVVPLTIPLSFLAQPDNQDQMQTPAKGDSGTMQVDYTITDVQGDQAIVTPNAVNGNDLAAEEAGESPDDADEQEGSDLRSMALQQ
jgi:hypothetical protein